MTKKQKLVNTKAVNYTISNEAFEFMEGIKDGKKSRHISKLITEEKYKIKLSESIYYIANDIASKLGFLPNIWIERLILEVYKEIK